MVIAILGRQPKLGIAELERVFSGKSVTLLSPQTVSIDTDQFDVQRFGGVPKAGKIILELPIKDWRVISQKIIQHYSAEWANFESKITLGISVFDINVSSRDVQQTGIILKQKLKKSGVSMRLVPNTEPALNTAVSHHNKLGLSKNKIELLVIGINGGKTIIAESTGAQNITAYARRDQERPKRDAFVGMLPPKLAQIMINLTGIDDSRVAVGGAAPDLPQTVTSFANQGRTDRQDPTRKRILDPFCGTGVILQEAILMGYSAYGTDLSEKMISYSHDNLEWLSEGYHTKFDYKLSAGNAMTMQWQQPIDAVVGETYLGQPFSAPPSSTKLVEVTENCNHIISEFLKNLSPQIKSGTSVCIAVPAWRDTHGGLTHLPLVEMVGRFGFSRHEFTNVSQNDMVYFRENQVVARELLVLTKN